MASKRTSAGLLMYRSPDGALEVFLVHPGGPLFARKDAGAWSVPKGEIEADEEALSVARREFDEETGQSAESCGAAGRFVDLGSVRQAGGKLVLAWAFEGDWPAGARLVSNTFEMEWPPRSGKRRAFPEVDRGEFFGLDEARAKLNPAQVAFLERLVERIP